MSRDSAVRARKRAIRARAVAERGFEERFYSRVPEPVCCKHPVSLRSWHGGILMFIKCYGCDLEMREGER